MSEYNFQILQGETRQEIFQFADQNGTVLPLTGISARMQLRIKNADGSMADELTTANGRITANTATNKLTLNWSATQSTALPVDFYAYDLELYDIAGVVIKPCYGTITVLREVTR